MISLNKVFFDLFIAFHLLGTHFQYVQGGHFNVRGWVELSMWEQLNQLRSNQLKVLLLAVGIVASQHFLLSFYEV